MKGKLMSRRTVVVPTTLLAVVVLTLAMVGAYAARPHESGPAARIVTVTHVAQTTAALGTTTQAATATADGFAVEMFNCVPNRTAGGPGTITCSARWVGGRPPFNPVFVPNPGGTRPSLSIFPNRTATFTFGCLRNREYEVTFFVVDIDLNKTDPPQKRKVPCGNL
jgi:hypothetical protein